jgi:hypothetical protein
MIYRGCCEILTISRISSKKGGFRTKLQEGQIPGEQIMDFCVTSILWRCGNMAVIMV